MRFAYNYYNSSIEDMIGVSEAGHIHDYVETTSKQNKGRVIGMTQGKLILVVDDQKGMRLLFEEVFSHYGYRVKTASSGVEALSLLADTSPGLVLLDMNMPGLSGYETLQKLRAQRPALPVIMISADVDDENWAKVEMLGVQGRLDKPFDLNDLVSMLAEILPN